MSKMILKKALLFSLFPLSMSTHAEPGKEFLANRCSELAKTVTSLVASQHNPACIDKLDTASTQMNVAASLIMSESPSQAKPLIDDAISALQFAELTGCNQYIQISHSKLEANKLRHLL